MSTEFPVLRFPYTANAINQIAVLDGYSRRSSFTERAACDAAMPLTKPNKINRYTFCVYYTTFTDFEIFPVEIRVYEHDRARQATGAPAACDNDLIAIRHSRYVNKPNASCAARAAASHRLSHGRERGSPPNKRIMPSRNGRNFRARSRRNATPYSRFFRVAANRRNCWYRLLSQIVILSHMNS
jgi:hypothetical protein